MIVVFRSIILSAEAHILAHRAWLCAIAWAMLSALSACALILAYFFVVVGIENVIAVGLAKNVVAHRQLPLVATEEGISKEARRRVSGATLPYHGYGVAITPTLLVAVVPGHSVGLV
jgi:hypothetical protein